MDKMGEQGGTQELGELGEREEEEAMLHMATTALMRVRVRILTRRRVVEAVEAEVLVVPVVPEDKVPEAEVRVLYISVR